ncbi:hypothetical protein Trydic_g22386 [Trypoxylus dichotomus]
MERALYRWFPKLGEQNVPVRKFQQDNNLPNKALLLLDNAPSHPPEEELKSDDGLFYMPPNVTPFIQPLDQNVIRITMLHYGRSLLTQLVAKETNISPSLENYSLRDAVLNFILAWNSLEPTVIEE